MLDGLCMGACLSRMKKTIWILAWHIEQWQRSLKPGILLTAVRKIDKGEAVFYSVSLFYFSFLLNMHSYFPSVVSFSNTKDSIQSPPNDSDDYGQQLADAVDVQEIDTNLYASKQLWLPLGSRGAFGGQVRKGNKTQAQKYSANCLLASRSLPKHYVQHSILLQRHSWSM